MHKLDLTKYHRYLIDRLGAFYNANTRANITPEQRAYYDLMGSVCLHELIRVFNALHPHRKVAEAPVTETIL